MDHYQLVFKIRHSHIPNSFVQVSYTSKKNPCTKGTARQLIEQLQSRLLKAREFSANERTAIQALMSEADEWVQQSSAKHSGFKNVIAGTKIAGARYKVEIDIKSGSGHFVK